MRIKNLTIGATFIFASLFSNSQSICFDPAADNRYPTIGGPRSIQAGDFDEDGNLDVITGNNGANVNFLKGNGDGSFQAPIELNQGAGDQVAGGELNNDGHRDIVAYSNSNGIISILFGNGDGTFDAPITFETGIQSELESQFSLGDFTNDNLIDIAVSSPATDQVLLIGNFGNGLFIQAPSITTQDHPVNISTGDLNNDGYHDLVVAYYSIAEVDVFINNNGISATPTSYPVSNALGNSLSEIEIVDINDAGGPDIIIGGQGTFEILMNNSNTASFTAASDVQTGSYCYGIIVGDWDNDFDFDAAIANNTSGGVTIKTNDGAGYSSSIQFFSANEETVELCSGDFNNDGFNDIVTANDANNNITFLQGNGDTTFGTLNLITGNGGNGIASGDFDNDGDIDVAGMSDQFSSLSINLNNGDGTFGLTNFLSVGYPSDQLVANDFNNDGNIDLATHSNAGFVIFSGNGNGTFSVYAVIPTSSLSFGGDRTIITDDFNNDGNADLAGTYLNQNELSVALGNGDGSFQPAIVTLVGNYPRYITSGDLNGDILPEIVISSNGSNEAYVLQNNGDGTFASPQILNVGNSPEGVTIFDSNGDGFNDLVVACPNSNNLYIFLSNSGSISSASIMGIPNGTNVGGLDNADINNDGYQDILAAFYQSDNVGIFFGNGNGTFNDPVTFDADQNPNLIVADYFNDDEAIDIAVLNSGTNNISVILNNSAYVTASGPTAFCEGGSVTLTASEGYSYEWSNGETTQSIEVTTDGDFVCYISNQLGDCILQTTSIEVIVEDVVNVVWNESALQDFCLNSEPAVLGGAQPLGGTYSGPGVSNGVFDPTIVGVGIYEITYTYESLAGCFDGTVTQEVEVLDNLNVSLNLPDASPCLNVNYTLSGGEPAGGTYYVNGAEYTTFNTSDLGIGIYEVSYFYNLNQNCGGNATQDLEIESCIGIEENNIETLMVFPTITSGEITITGFDFDKIIVQDATGKTVQTITNPETNTINISHLAKGTYFLQISNDKTGKT
ncbi:MAG: hypothetical protein RLZZ262_645, partial [Bacteroidota bacterium]